MTVNIKLNIEQQEMDTATQDGNEKSPPRLNKEMHREVIILSMSQSVLQSMVMKCTMKLNFVSACQEANVRRVVY
jgi:hypothetical protein